MVRLSFWWIADTGLRLYHCQRCALCFKQDRALVDGQRTEVVTLHTTTSVFVQGALCVCQGRELASEPLQNCLARRVVPSGQGQFLEEGKRRGLRSVVLKSPPFSQRSGIADPGPQHAQSICSLASLLSPEPQTADPIGKA